jgi:hypothetical protein
MNWKILFVDPGYLYVEVRDGVHLALLPDMLFELHQATQVNSCHHLLVVLFFPVSNVSALDLGVTPELSKIRRTVQYVRAAIWRPSEYGKTPVHNFNFMINFFGNGAWELAYFDAKDLALEWLMTKKK